ncbi:hypothetical protein F4678DRAFT_428375 [Xylaria arbuscula]|nr:hypothetical protein F4678DRAFT_428375 [Xylaria arbuscula]
MSGLTLNTEAAAASKPLLQQQSSANRASSLAPGSSNNNNPPARPFQSTTPIPVPIPMSSYISREQQPQQPQQLQPQPQTSSRSASPLRPTYSPITPPLNATTLPPRPTYQHSSHVDATAAPAPLPEPIDFDSNPDVLALKSAISILQMQRRKAERDMATLDRVKRTALAEPEAFVRDLKAGRIRVEGGGLLSGNTEGEVRESDSDSDSDGDGDGDNRGDQPSQTKEEINQPQAILTTTAAEKSQVKSSPNAQTARPAPWPSIPKPQSIVRCPPINWSQYAVVGESLDKLHNEQVRRPAQGTPATLTADGRFEFRGGEGGGGSVGKQVQYHGVAAPYAPGKDAIERKSKTSQKR